MPEEDRYEKMAEEMERFRNKDKVRCLDCVYFEDFSRNVAYCTKCKKDVPYNLNEKGVNCIECGNEVFINKCGLLEIWNIIDFDKKEHCEYYEEIDQDDLETVVGIFEGYDDKGRVLIRTGKRVRALII